MTGSTCALRRTVAATGLALLCLFALGAPAGAQEHDDFDCVPDTSTAQPDDPDAAPVLICPAPQPSTTDTTGGEEGGGGAGAGGDEGGGDADDDGGFHDHDCVVRDTSTAQPDEPVSDTETTRPCPISGGTVDGGAEEGGSRGVGGTGAPTRIDAGVGGAAVLAQVFDDCPDTTTAAPDEPVTDTDTFVDCASGGGGPTSAGDPGSAGGDTGADGDAGGTPTRIDAGAGGAAAAGSSAPAALAGIGAAAAAGIALLRRR